MPTEKIRVAICGGGIVGATLANLLLKHSDKIEVQIYEAAKQFGEIGAGLGLWSRAMEVFKEASLELYEACYKIAVIPDPNDPLLAMRMRVGDQKPNGYEFGQWKVEGISAVKPALGIELTLTIGGPIMFHRASLLDILVAKIPKDKVNFGKRLASYEQVPSGTVHELSSSISGEGQEVVLHFTDGTSTRADVLVGADGIKSAIRKQMYTSYASEVGASIEEFTNKYIEPAWSGSVAYRSLIPIEELKKVRPDHSVFRGPQQYLGQDKHLTVFRLNETHINMVAFVSDHTKYGTRYPDEKTVKDVSQEELFQSFEDFEDEAQEMFKLMPKPSLWAINFLKETLPFYVRGNVVLIGDAAHAMTPHLGIGAGMGIEDASVLTHFLTSQHINCRNLHLALKAHDNARVQKTSEVLHRAHAQGRTYEYRTEGVWRDVEKIQEWIDKNTEAIARWKVGDDVRKGLEWIEDEVKKERKGELKACL